MSKEPSHEVAQKYNGLEGFNGETPLVLGSITGYRSFQVSEAGYLTPVIVNPEYEFKEGINEGNCKLNSTIEKLNAVTHQLLINGGHDPESEEAQRFYFPPHRVGSKNCSCGYYAYTTKENYSDFHTHNGVLGVVEGSGLATVGDKGFRAEKLKIIALAEKKPLSKERAFLSGVTLQIICLLINVVSVLINLYGSYTSGTIRWLPLSLNLFTSIFIFFFIQGNIKRIKMVEDDKNNPRKPEVLAKLKEHYPTVKWYPSEKALLKAYPLSKGTK